jgi:hypothetical protein
VAVWVAGKTPACSKSSSLKTESTLTAKIFGSFVWAMEIVVGVEGFNPADVGIQHVHAEQADKRGVEVVDDLAHFKFAYTIHVHDLLPFIFDAIIEVGDRGRLAVVPSYIN